MGLSDLEITLPEYFRKFGMMDDKNFCNFGEYFTKNGVIMLVKRTIAPVIE